MTQVAVGPRASWPARGSFRDVTREQWMAFIGSYLGWVLDGFDYTILTFLLVDVQRSFAVNATLAGLLGQITLMFRLVGGIGAGTAADRWGRKGPLMFSILWYSGFAFLSGFSTSYGMLFTCRALFGIGMGGVWAAGMPLTLEHWPAHLRGAASGMMQSGYSLGFLLSALVFQFGYPLVNHQPDLGWRAMLWIGVLPAFLVLFIRKHVQESPVWLERQRHLKSRRETDPVSLTRLFSRTVLPTTLHTSLVMGAFMFLYHSISYWYPTLLGSMGWPTLPFLLAFNVGAIAGAAAIGRLSETGLGRRGAAVLATFLGMLAIPIYVYTSNGVLLWTGALLMGIFGAGNFGVVPAYLTERFPTVARAAGAGFAYHVGAALGSFTPTLVGHLQDRGLPLATAMAACIAGSGLILIVLIWMGPETRGRAFHAIDGES